MYIMCHVQRNHWNHHWQTRNVKDTHAQWLYDHTPGGIMIEHDHKCMLDDSWNENGEYPDWSVVDSSLLPSEPACHVICTPCKTGMPLESNRWCIFWPEKAVQIVHHMIHSTCLQCDVRIYSRQISWIFGPNWLNMLTTYISPLTINHNTCLLTAFVPATAILFGVGHVWYHLLLNPANCTPYRYGYIWTVRTRNYTWSHDHCYHVFKNRHNVFSIEKRAPETSTQS